ncbi:MAG: putative porin [Bacteroidales bacterium]|nr:putative porin [Bacteroidales bacterium]
MRIHLIFVFSILYALSTYAQRTEGDENAGGENAEDIKKDVRSPDSVFVSYFSLNEQGAYTRYTVSKPLTHFEEYDVTKQNNQFYANLGNPGSASYPLLFKLNPSPNFRFRSDVYEPYTLKDDSIKFYISSSPFSHLMYHMGPAKEQKFNIAFSQRIGNGIYLGLNARFANSPGLYLRQRAFNAGGTFYAAFLYPSQRYGAILTYRTDYSLNYENGGISDITSFTQNIESNRKVIEVNLSDATNRSKSNGFVLQQYFNILKPTIARKIDTTTILVPRKFDAGRIIYTMRYSRTGTAYEDNSSPSNFYTIYPSYFYDTIQIFDSIKLTHFENCIVYSNEVPDTLGKSFPLQYSFGIRFQTDKLLRDTTLQDVFRQTVPFGMLKGIIRQKTFFKASGFLVLGGYKSGDYSLDGSFYQFFGKQNHKAYLNVSKGMTHPDFYFTNYYTDYFKSGWDNSFGTQDYIKGEFGVILKGFDMKASYTRLTNYVYLNQYILPKQYTNALTVLAVHASKEFRLKHWITNVYVAGQQITPDSILQLPALIGKISLCYDVELFKKALHSQIGVSGTYHSQWYQDAYMPALRAFYRQNNYLSGNYPYMDVFININIKRARMFVKYEHFNAALMSYNYILVPDYPQADAAFKFGISWLFFD